VECFYAHIVLKLEELSEIQLCFYSRFRIFMLPNHISVLVMPNDYPVYFLPRDATQISWKSMGI